MGDQATKAPQQEQSEPASAEKSAAQEKTPSASSYLPPQGLSVFGAASPDDIPLTRDNILHLQRTIGNGAVARLLQRKAKLSQPGDSWKLSGDATLNDDTRNIARKAVAQSQLNVISSYNLIGPLSTSSMFKVWDYTPRPSTVGIKQLVEEVKKGTEVSSADLKKAVGTLIQANYLLIIDPLVSLKKLRKT